jgi:hypothetical protein
LATQTSSITTALRAIVMLICLVAVPLAAVFGTSLPDVAKRLLEGRWSGDPAVATQDVEESPHYRPEPAGKANWPAAEAAPPDVIQADFQAHDGFDSKVERVVWQAPGPAASDSSSRLLHAAAELAGESVRDDGVGAVKPRKLEALEKSLETPPGEPLTAEPSAGPIPPLSATDRFADAQKRLRELGATYYLLEAWGADGQHYRFHCEMAIAGNPHHTRHFEKTDSEPMRAVARVLQEVEAWRAGR